MALADKYFKEEINKLLTEGFNDEAYEVRPKWPDGTPAHTIKSFCAVRRYDLSKEFPALTLRTQAFKGVVRELLWMWQKKSNVVDELGKSASIWRA
jgi:thymidylate synthase